jgi:hypothetical protein
MFNKLFLKRSLFYKVLLIGTIFFIAISLFITILVATDSLAPLAVLDNLVNSSNFSGSFGLIIDFWTLFLLILGLPYFLIGIGRFIYEKKKKIQTPLSWHPKSLIVKGVISLVAGFLIFFIGSLVLAFFGLSLGNCMCLPTFPGDSQNNSTGFPIQDLQIVGIEQNTVNPSPDEEGRECIITIKNTSSTLTATNVALYYYDGGESGAYVEDDYATGDDHIPPGSTYQVDEQVYQNNCDIKSSVKILNAGIVKNP